MPISTVPERLAMMLIDCHESIVAAYDYTQAAIDRIERPSWLIFIEDATYPQIGNDQELVEQNYSIAFIGNIWSVVDNVYSVEYEKQAREIADASIKYFFEHKQLQMSNIRGKFPSELPSLNSVLSMNIGNRSAVTLFSRDAVAGQAFWGFTFDITLIEQLMYDPVGLS